MDQVTAVSVFHPDGGAPFGEWARSLTACAADADGCVSTRIAVEGGQFEPAVAVTFADEAQLDRWLDSAARAEVLQAGREQGWWPSAPVLVLAADSPPPPGVAAFRHRLAAGRRAEFLTAQGLLTDAAARFSGYEGTSLFLDDAGGESLSVLRFRTDRQLAAWTSSPQRVADLPDLRSSLSRDFVPMTSTTPLGTTVRNEHGRIVMTPNWKSAMLLLLVLYPTVMTLSRYLGPVLDRLFAPPWLALWLSQVVSVSLMQWWLMPWVSRPFRRWLDPVEGTGWRSNLAGAAAIVVLYAVTLLLFETLARR
ncbi:antibiotic biosynthesis monooxygenase [Mycobacterium sp. NPDC050551]|uniref:antibiotic biosynthesis monooxygenase n=1 Tax=Mycobacterium sp. NPDC050551 TaxID=3155407 RepID=UPI00342B446C